MRNMYRLLLDLFSTFVVVLGYLGIIIDVRIGVDILDIVVK